MIRDVLIIKDGLPLLSKNFTNSNTIFSQGESLMMMTGFFSAMNSFSDQFDNLGTVSELKLSKNDLKLSFLREKSLPNLVYLATFDENSKGVNVQRTLRKISRTFLQKYNVNQILNWRGRRDAFEEFENIISKYIDDEKQEHEEDFKEKIEELFKNVEEKLNEGYQLNKEEKQNQLPEYFLYTPSLKISKKINLGIYLTGKVSIDIFDQIDGNKTIELISKNLKLSPEKVYNICKNLVKLGFVNLY
jgi:DNA-binding Lrp family transcriptional regulator